MNRVLIAGLLLVPCFAFAQPRVQAEAGMVNLLWLAKGDYERTKAGPRVAEVVANSSTGALAALCRGDIAIAGTSRAATAEEKGACAENKAVLVELPVATDGVVMVVNPANGWAKKLSLTELRSIWLDAVARPMTWKLLNPDWPGTPVKLYGPGPKLGLTAHARAAFLPAADSVLQMRNDINATEVLAVVADGVARDRDALGLLDEPTYAANMKRVRRVPVEGLPTFPVYIHTTAAALGDPAVRAMLDHLLANGARLTAQSGLVALAPGAYEEARKRMGGVK